jgi:pilus assembly protein CpaB
VDAPEQLSTTGSLAALSIPRGMVAVSVPISRLSSVSYAPQAGDHVNVIVTLMFVDLDTEFQTALPDRNTGIVGPGSGQANLTGSAGASVGTERDPVKQEATGGTQAQIQASSLVAVSGGGGGVIGRVYTDPQLNETFYIIPGEQRQRPRIVSQNLLQDIIVLNVGNFPYAQQPTLQPTPAPEAQPAVEGGVQQQPAQATQPPDVITLIVSPQDAITLNYLLFSGAQLTMALRSANDDTRVQTDPVTLQFLLSTYNVAIPAKLPNGMEPARTELTLPALRNDAIPTPAP